MPADTKTRNHPPKQFALPADVRALGQTGAFIGHAIRNEVAKRRERGRKAK